MLPPPLVIALILCVTLFNSAHAHLNVSSSEAKKLYNIPFYSYPGKNGFEKQNVHIKDETVIMLCYLKQTVQMLVYWKSGLSVKEAEDWMKQNGSDWQEQKTPGYDNEVIRQHEDEFNFRLDPYLKQLRTWKNSNGDLAFFDSFRHELIIQSAMLGTKKIEVPDADFYSKIGQLETGAPQPSDTHPVPATQNPVEPKNKI